MSGDKPRQMPDDLMEALRIPQNPPTTGTDPKLFYSVAEVFREAAEGRNLVSTGTLGDLKEWLDEGAKLK